VSLVSGLNFNALKLPVVSIVDKRINMDFEIGLLANEVVFGNLLSPPLPPDQWIREVRLWFETSLAMMQELTLGFVDISSFSNTDGAFILRPVAGRPEGDRKAAEWQCTDQKVRSRGQVQNFNVAGLIVIVVSTLSIVLVGLLLEICVGIFRHFRRGRPGRLRQFARASDNLYWLLHTGLRGSGAYPWRYGSQESVADEEIPVIDPSARFESPMNDDGSWAPFYRYLPQQPKASTTV
jgi:hypothetical protein